jgi:hypothetical protein
VSPALIAQPVSLVLLAQQSAADLTLTVVLRGAIVHRESGRGRAVVPLSVFHMQVSTSMSHKFYNVRRGSFLMVANMFS